MMTKKSQGIVYIWISLLKQQLLTRQCYNHVQVDSKLVYLRTTLGALRKSRSLCSSCSSSSPPSSVSPPGWQSSASLSLSFVGHPQSPSGFFISIIHLHAHLHRHFFRLFSPRAARWRRMWCGKYLHSAQSLLNNLTADIE